jgi:Cys-tRNA synthase (O-phospho-L-seryl-tRNA:Cys-tRNA synthase)
MLEKLPSGFGIVIVDMQPFYTSLIAAEKMESMFSAQLEILEVCENKDYPLVVLEMEGGEKTMSPLKEAIIRVPRSRTLIKPDYNGFDSTDLVEVLDEFGIYCIGLIGVNASGCIKATAQGKPKSVDFLVSQSLMADNWATDGPFQTGHIYNAAIDWYKENALAYFTSHRDLLELMEAKC